MSVIMLSYAGFLFTCKEGNVRYTQLTLVSGFLANVHFLEAPS